MTVVLEVIGITWFCVIPVILLLIAFEPIQEWIENKFKESRRKKEKM